MPAVTEELALRYLLELSTDIRAALLLGREGELLASAPERPDPHSLERCAVLSREADALANGAGGPVELDITLPGGAVFLVREGERSLVCVTGPFALPGLILHDMRVVLDDLRRGGPEELDG
jgi:hypothetical protein